MIAPSTRIAAATGLSIAVYGMEATMLGTMLPAMSKVLTPAQGGTIAAAQSLGLIFGSLLTGPVLEKSGPKAGIVCGLVLIATGLIVLPASHTYLPILLTMTLLGLGGGVISTGTNTMASFIGGANRSSMLNLLNVFFGVGGLITPALGALLSSRALCGAIVLFASATLAMLIATKVPPASNPVAGRIARERRIFLRPVFLLLCLFLSLYVSAEVGIWNWLAVYLNGKGIPQSTALRVLSFGFAGGIIAGRLGASKLLSHAQPHRVTLACSILMAVTTSVMLLVDIPVLAGATVFCAGLAMAPVYPTTLGMIGGAFPQGMATAIGIAVTMGWVGVAASSKLIGSLAGASPEGLGRALLVIPAVSLVMVGVNLTFGRLVNTSGVSADPK